MHALKSPSVKKGPGRYLGAAERETLLRNVVEGAGHPSIGFEDAKETLESLIRKLNAPGLIKQSVLESALWSCNLRDERGEFWDVHGRTFQDFLTVVLGDARRFDRYYNMIKEY